MGCTVRIFSLPAVGDGAVLGFIVTAANLTPPGGTEPARGAAAFCATAHPASKKDSKWYDLIFPVMTSKPALR
jgi:hypothetical protein